MGNAEMVFVFPQYDDLKKNYIGTSYHLGAAYIQAYLEEKGIEVVQLVSPSSLQLGQLVDQILACGAPIVGFSCYDKIYYIEKIISLEIKRRNPAIKIVFGGPTASSADQTIMEDNPAIDVCVRHEGEITTLELIQRWRENKSIDDLLGITYRRNSELIRNPDGPQLSNGIAGGELDFLPSPYLTGKMPITEHSLVQFVSARGCPYKCTFCNNSLMGQHKIRRHSVDYILKELKYVASTGKKLNAFFVDDAFSIDIERAKTICRRIIDEKIKNLSFVCQTRVDHADEEMFSLFVEAGFKEIAFGLDTASPRILNIIKKVRNHDGTSDDYKKEKEFLERYKQNIQIAQSKGLRTYVSIILGLPTENFEDAKETLDFVKSLNVTAYTHNILQVFTGTELSKSLDRYGVQVKPGPFFLPYTVEFTYDVYSVPLSDNAIHRRIFAEISNSDHSNFLKLSGITEQGKNVQAPFQVGLKNIKEPSEQLCQWLSRNIALDTEIFFLNGEISEEESRNQIKTCAENHIPLIKYNQMRLTPGKDNVYQINDLIPELKNGPFHLYYDIKDFHEGKTKDRKPTEIHVRKIFDRKSFEELVKEMEDLALFDVVNLNSLVMDLYHIEDKCRWSQCTCRAVKLQSPIIEEIDSVANIRPCLSGRNIGTTAESIEALRERLEKLREETETRRGCAQCDARFQCSRCLFIPEFMDEQEYCEFRRDYIQFHKAIETRAIISLLILQMKANRIKPSPVNELQLSGLSSKIFYFNEAEEETVCDPIIRKGFIMVRLNKDFFLYDIEHIKLLQMNDKMAAMFEILENTPFNREKIISWLSEKYTISDAEAGETLNTALKLFRQLNILSDS